MVWAYTGIAILAAFTAWLVVTVFMTSKGERRTGAGLVGLVVFGVVCGFGLSTVTPRINFYMAEKRLEQELPQSTPFSELKQYDPLAYANLLNQLKTMLREGRTREEAFADAMLLTQGMLSTKLVQASDEAALAYMQAFSSLLDKAREKDPAVCSALGKLDSKTSDSLRQSGTPEQIKQLGAAMGKVFQSSAKQPQVAPAEMDVKPQLDAILMQLVELYGRDVLALGNPGAMGGRLGETVSQTRKCQMEAAVLRLMLRQPPEQAGKLVRFISARS